MRPFFNSFQPQLSNQVQSNGSNPPVNPQAFPMSMQPQMGVINPQIPVPFNGSNVNLTNMSLLTPQQAGILNALNQLGMSQMGQGLVGFPPQNHATNLSAMPMFFNQVGPFQGQGKGFAPNVSNLPQQFNQNMSLPNFQNPMHIMNPGVSVQMLNHSKGFPFNGPSGSHPALGPQNPNIFANPLFGAGLQNGIIPTMDVNASMPLATATQQGNSSTMPQNQNSQSPGFKKQQGGHIKDSKSGTSHPNWKHNPGKDFQRNAKRFQKSRGHQRHNGKNKFGSFNEHKGKGQGYEKAEKFGQNNHSQVNQPTATKRSLALTYTEQEIKQWCEERKKNYPSKANIEKKKQTEKIKDSKIFDEEAKLRREQLKQILAKQAELGVEVAEIPAQYLSDSEKQGHGRDNDRRSLNKKGSFRNKNKRGRYQKDEQFVKRQKISDKDLSNISPLEKRNPTLLQKLLSVDIRRDRHRLLQVFRFMVLNSFFKDWPEKPLKFPPVVVKDGFQNEIADRQLSLAGKDGIESFAGKDGVSFIKKKTDDNYCDVEDDDDDNNEHNAEVEQSTCLTRVKPNLIKEVNGGEEEEGEIID